MSMSGSRLTRLAALVAGCLVLFVAVAASMGQPSRDADTSTVRGRVERFTTAPKGETDGAVLDDGTWLHWPPHMQDRFTDVVKKGDRVKASGRTETGPAGDTHFEVQSVTNFRTKATAENPDFANGPPPPGPRGRAARADVGDDDGKTVQGKVQRFTTAPKGEVDGAVLDDGTVVHWPPHLEDRFKGIIDKGDRVKVIGRMETGPKGDTHLEVQTLTNLRTKESAENDAPPAPRRLSSDRGRNREQRLRALEKQLDQMRKEIERLRRDK